MKSEPLKNKDFKTDCEDGLHWFVYNDIKSAVEWLKAELKEYMIYLHRGDETYLFKQINKAFEDVIEKN